MGIERSQAGPVGQMFDPHPRLVQLHFVNLAGHDGAGDTVALEVADRPTQFCQTDPAEIIDHPTQGGLVGVVFDSETINLISGRSQRLGDHQRIAAPAGNQTDSTLGGWRRVRHH